MLASSQTDSLPALQIPKSSRSLVSYPSFLWSQVLFPGQAKPETEFRWRSFAILLLVSAALLYPCLSFYLFEPDEGRYAEIPREMLARGEWLDHVECAPVAPRPCREGRERDQQAAHGEAEAIRDSRRSRRVQSTASVAA